MLRNMHFSIRNQLPTISYAHNDKPKKSEKTQEQRQNEVNETQCKLSGFGLSTVMSAACAQNRSCCVEMHHHSTNAASSAADYSMLCTAQLLSQTYLHYGPGCICMQFPPSVQGQIWGIL